MSDNRQLIVHTSEHPVTLIQDRLQEIFQQKGITLFALVDHSTAAQKAGLSLNEEKLLIFGDPKTGTFLMQENPAIGIELPLKILLWKSQEGITHIAFKDPAFLADAYGIKKNADILSKMKAALSALIDHVKV